MRIEIDFHRNRPKNGAGVDVANFDPGFMRKLESFVEAENIEWKYSEYRKLRESFTNLIRSIEKIIPEDTEQPFQIVINVGGEIDNSPGPRLY